MSNNKVYKPKKLLTTRTSKDTIGMKTFWFYYRATRNKKESPVCLPEKDFGYIMSAILLEIKERILDGDFVSIGNVGKVGITYSTTDPLSFLTDKNPYKKKLIDKKKTAELWEKKPELKDKKFIYKMITAVGRVRWYRQKAWVSGKFRYIFRPARDVKTQMRTILADEKNRIKFVEYTTALSFDDE